MPTITPRGEYLDLKRHRFILGREKLRLQGLVFDDTFLDAFPEALLGDLAGNAFTATTCCGPICALLLVDANVALGLSQKF